jgi:hypothetical protein
MRWGDGSTLTIERRLKGEAPTKDSGFVVDFGHSSELGT